MKVSTTYFYKLPSGGATMELKTPEGKVIVKHKTDEKSTAKIVFTITENVEFEEDEHHG